MGRKGKFSQKEFDEPKEANESRFFFRLGRLILFIIGMFLLFLLISMSTKLFYYARFLLGNDVLVGINANQEDFNLVHGEEEKVTFDTHITTNPFCTAECYSEFIDMASGEIIESDNFTLSSIVPITKSYTLKADRIGKGQKLYRFDMNCKSFKTIICNTEEKPISRSVLITLNYDLNEEEKELKNLSKIQIDSWITSLNTIEQESDAFLKTINEMNNSALSLSFDQRINTIKGNISSAIKEINYLIEIWRTQNYYILNEEVRSKREIFEAINNDFEYITSILSKEIKKEALEKEIKLFIEYDSLCTINNICTEHQKIIELTNKTYFNITNNCEKINDLIKFYYDLNISNKDIFNAQNYPNTLEFKGNITLKVKNIKQNIINEYLNQLIKNETNTEIIKSILIPSDLDETQDYPYNLTAALISELTNQKIEECNLSNTLFSEFEKNKIKNINDSKILNLSFDEPELECCVFGNCEGCCIEEECQNDPSKFPIIFLHGHDFSKGISAEYAFNAFNDIQKDFEKDGYINAGIITISDKKTSSNVLLINYPVTFRTSYYFDLLNEFGNYTNIQTKSENIDTYAIRLNEIINLVKYETNRPKVNIVSHSMGGLVARRYLQIFGTRDVDKLILVATPNKGIEGSISKYCPVFGAEIECRDMDKNSLFINKLNDEPLPNIPIYNIIGDGCNMNGLSGDGVVLERSSFLEGAENYHVNGTCKTINLFHTDIIDTKKYPETYNLIKKAFNKTI